ncbi:MAG TPA: methyltransferase domain-containing protein [Chloroflexia bacterium]|nr:methyltransferase domain-containing protein [Chloroflexia bacterium]
MSSDKDLHKLVQSQFGPAASAYSTSASHSNQSSLNNLVKLVQPKPADVMLDVATGAGHTALAFAPYLSRVVAYDLTPEMLEETARSATARGISNLETQQGLAEALPYPDNSFDLVTCRIAPHHFSDIKKALAEMARVTRPGGQVVVVDTTVPEDSGLDQEINYIEKQRDPSHVRNYRPSEWRKMFEEAHLEVTFCEVDLPGNQQGRINFAEWTARLRTPAETVLELSHRLRKASPELQQALALEIRGDQDKDIEFSLQKVTIIGSKSS